MIMAFVTNLTGPNLIVNEYINGAPSGVDNRHGNIRAGGTISDSTNFSASTLGEGNDVVTIVENVGGVTGSVPGNFNSGLQVINLAQTTIAGTANTTLQGGQSNSANDANTPMSIDVVRTYYYKTDVVAGNWNVFTGAFSSVTNSAIGVYDIDKAGDSAANVRASGTDIATTTSSDSPGRLTYRDGSPDPTNGAYGARHNW